MKVTLVIMAAGMGSRFGGLKQIEPVGKNGEIIADYSVYDAKKAGFTKVVFVIKREMEKLFKEKAISKISRFIEAEYVFQELDCLPHGFAFPLGREKPWGTAHAVLACKGVVNEPFAVINADDFYGASAYKELYNYLTAHPDTSDCYHYCMAGYRLANTVTENGHVSRGVCQTDSDGYLVDIEEFTKIEKRPDGIKYTFDNTNYIKLPNETIVSMNAWGFHPSLFDEIEKRFGAFLNNSKDNILKAEYFLPSVISELMEENLVKVKVLPAKDMWYGFTYKEDKETVKKAIAEMTGRGIYPERLW